MLSGPGRERVSVREAMGRTQCALLDSSLPSWRKNHTAERPASLGLAQRMGTCVELWVRFLCCCGVVCSYLSALALSIPLPFLRKARVSLCLLQTLNLCAAVSELHSG